MKTIWLGNSSKRFHFFFTKKKTIEDALKNTDAFNSPKKGLASLSSFDSCFTALSIFFSLLICCHQGRQRANECTKLRCWARDQLVGHFFAHCCYLMEYLCIYIIFFLSPLALCFISRNCQQLSKLLHYSWDDEQAISWSVYIIQLNLDREFLFKYFFLFHHLLHVSFHENLQ